MKRLIILLLVAMLMPMLVAAATITDLTLTGEDGTTVSGTVFVNDIGIDDVNLELSSSGLTSGSNTIAEDRIVISSISESEFGVSVAIPSGQASGTYIGTLSLYSGSTLLDESTIIVIVESTTGQGASFTISALDLGSSNQKREQTVSGTFSVQNTGSESLTITLTGTANADYQLALSKSSVTLASGESTTVTATAYVPDDQDSGKKTIGSVTGTSGSLSQSSTVSLTTKTELVIDKVKVEVDGKSETVDDGEEVDAKLRDEVVIRITVENTFDDRIDIEDITITVESDNDLDWDDDKDMGDLGDGDDDMVEFTFDVPTDIDEDEYDVDITIEGEDENGAMHEDTLSFTIVIDKERHEISIIRASVSPSTFKCDGGTATVTVDIENTGASDEDKAAIEIKNAELDIYKYDERFSLDEGDDTKKIFTITVPKNAKEGEYFLNIRTYTDGNDLSDEYVTSIIVDKCTTTVTQPPLGNGGTGTGTGTGSNPPPAVIIPSGSAGPVYGSTSFFNSPAYMILLVAAILIFIILILVLLMKFVF